jgi:hypothetical protein
LYGNGLRAKNIATGRFIHLFIQQISFHSLKANLIGKGGFFSLATYIFCLHNPWNWFNSFAIQNSSFIHSQISSN